MSATTDSKQPLIRFTDVSLGYGDFTVLKNINLEAKRGQVIAMMGGSGSGKTTLLRGATAQIFAQAGKIEVFDKDLGQCSPREIEQLRKRMGVLFQQGALFTDLNEIGRASCRERAQREEVAGTGSQQAARPKEDMERPET